MCACVCVCVCACAKEAAEADGEIRKHCDEEAQMMTPGSVITKHANLGRYNTSLSTVGRRVFITRPIIDIS